MSVDEQTGTWRHQEERAELVARLVLAERRARVAESKVRGLLGDRDHVSALAARVVELEDIVSRLNEKLARAHRRPA